MKYLTFIAIFLVALSTADGCKNKNDDSDNLDPANARMVQSTKHLDGTWIISTMMDPYVGEKQKVVDNRKRITLGKNGSYTETTPGSDQVCKGEYKLIEGYLIVTHDCNKAELKYRVIESEKKKLTLGIQGRHGEVVYEHEPSKRK